MSSKLMKTPSFRVSNVSCCVVGCHNSYANTDENVHFYRFPNKPYEQLRRKIWINSVRRDTSGNKPWEPKSNDRVCSEHFVGNCKSNIEKSPSYNPTIFPKAYKRLKGSIPTQRRERVRRSLKKPKQTTGIFFENSKDIAVQANVDSHSIKETQNKRVGKSANVTCAGFHGRSSVSNRQAMASLGGVSLQVFNLLLQHLSGEHGNDKLSAENKLLLFLMKMKLGLSYHALAVFFNIHFTSASRIFLNILKKLVHKMSNYVFWPSREIISQIMPKAFVLHYPDCRVIIDFIEIRTEHPNAVDNQVSTYSNYKGAVTAKFLLGIAPNGFISFVSNCYSGRCSDPFITNDCGILNLLEPSDKVLADKGFSGIKCNDNGVLVMPPFVHDGELTVEEVEAAKRIASVRIHVERSIQRIKMYKILQKIPHSRFPHIDMVVRMCCILANLQPPFIKDVSENQME